LATPAAEMCSFVVETLLLYTVSLVVLYSHVHTTVKNSVCFLRCAEWNE